MIIDGDHKSHTDLVVRFAKALNVAQSSNLRAEGPIPNTASGEGHKKHCPSIKLHDESGASNQNLYGKARLIERPGRALRPAEASTIRLSRLTAIS
jgi:hypothetical protein